MSYMHNINGCALDNVMAGYVTPPPGPGPGPFEGVPGGVPWGPHDPHGGGPRRPVGVPKTNDFYDLWYDGYDDGYRCYGYDV